MPKLIPQSIIVVQTSLSQFLALVFQSITQPLILAIANLISKISLFFLPEIYLKIPPPHETEYFSQEDLFADMRNHTVINGFVVTINSSRPTKVYLVYDQGTKYRN